MPAVKEENLRAQLKSKCLKPVYLLYGPDVYLKQYYAEKIAATAPAEAEKLSGEDFDVSDFLDKVQMPDFSGNGRCYIICDLDFEKLAKADFDEMKAYLADPPDMGVTVFWFDSVELDYKRSSKAKAIIAAANKGGCTALLEHRTGLSLAKVLCDRATKQRRTLPTSDANYMIQRCGDDLQQLLGEVDKLCLYCDDVITRDDIDKICTVSVTASVYDMTAAIVSGDAKKALTLYNNLRYEQVENIVILSVISSGFADIYRASAALDRGIAADKAASDMGYGAMSWKLKNAARLARGINGRKIRLLIEMTANADAEIKSSAADQDIIMETLIMSLIRQIKAV